MLALKTPGEVWAYKLHNYFKIWGDVWRAPCLYRWVQVQCWQLSATVCAGE